MWPEPEVFDPERHLRPDHPRACPLAADLQPFAFLGFGAGPRRCIGEPLAMAEIKLVLAVLFRRLQFAPTADFCEESACNLTLRPRHGMPVRIECV